MAAVFGVISGAITVAEAAGTLISLCRQIKSAAHTVKHAPEEVRAAIDLIEALETVLTKLEDAAKAAVESKDSVDCLADLRAPQGPIEKCRICLQKILALLPSINAAAVPKRGVSKKLEQFKFGLTWKRRVSKKLEQFKFGLTWKRKASEAKALLDEVKTYQDVIQARLNIATHQEVGKAKVILKDNERREFYTWLEQDFKDYDKIQERWHATRETETCTWILKRPEWQQWLAGESASRLLWVEGGMGVGKTILMSFVVDHFAELQGEDKKTARAYYYCHYTHSRDESQPFLRCILGQLCRRLKSIPGCLNDAFRDIALVGTDALLAAIEECLEGLETVFVVLDAIDESAPCSQLLKLIAVLATEDRFSKLRIVAASCPSDGIEEALTPISVPLHLSLAEVGPDIQKFIRSTLEKDGLSWWSADLKDEVAERVAERAGGMFRLAASQLDLLSRMVNDETIISGLETLPETVHKSYDRILAILSKEQRAVVIGVLLAEKYGIWLYGEQLVEIPRILSLSTYNEAGNDSTADYRAIRRWCGSFIKADAGSPTESSSTDETGVTIQLAHRSVSEYLGHCLKQTDHNNTLRHFMCGILRDSSMNIGSRDSLLCHRVRPDSEFCMFIPEHKETAKAYSDHLRADMHYLVSEVFRDAKGEMAFIFLGGAMQLKKHVLFYVLLKLCADYQVSSIIKCREKIGFLTLLKDAPLWPDWWHAAKEIGSELRSRGTTSIENCMILAHDHHRSCGTSCLLDEQHMRLRWKKHHVILAMILLDYEGIKALLNPTADLEFLSDGYYVSDKDLPYIVQAMITVAWYPGVQCEHVRYICKQGNLLEVHGFLSTIAVFPEKERRVWGNIRRALEAHIQKKPTADSMGRESPEHLQECAAPDLTEQEMETLREEMDEYVDHLVDIHQDVMVDNFDFGRTSILDMF